MSVKTRTELKGYFENGDTPDETQFSDLIDSMHLKSENIPIQDATIGEQELTSGAAVTWDFANGSNAYMTLGHNATLTVDNMQIGQYGALVIKQDATGGRTLTLPAGSKVGYSGAGAVSLTSAANAIDVVTVYRSNHGYLWLINKTFT